MKAAASAALLAAIATGCAGGAAGAPRPGGAAGPVAQQGAAVASVERPLAALARGGGIVLPVQRLDLAGGLPAPAGGGDALLRALDQEIAFALSERGVGASVATAAVAERLARSNPTYAADPRALALPTGRAMQGGDEVTEPLASQLRAIAALADRRVAVVPLSLRLESAAEPATEPEAEPATSGGGTARAVLRLALVDVRLSKVLWAGETEATDLQYPSAALAPRVAARFADLIVAPREP